MSQRIPTATVVREHSAPVNIPNNSRASSKVAHNVALPDRSIEPSPCPVCHGVCARGNGDSGLGAFPICPLCLSALY